MRPTQSHRMAAKLRISWETLLTATLVICAVITTGLVIYRGLFAPAARPASSGPQKPVFVENWKSHLDKGVRVGPPDAAVRLIEFADFECPFCASFHMELKALRGRYPTQVALSYVHYPLPGHRFAEPAARAAECAGEQGRFEAMQDDLYEQQKEFGLKPWTEFAAAAGVADLAAFESCIKSKEPLRRIVDGKQLAEQLDVKGTPTLVVNGWRLAKPPSAKELDGMVKAILAGRSPVLVAK